MAEDLSRRAFGSLLLAGAIVLTTNIPALMANTGSRETVLDLRYLLTTPGAGRRVSILFADGMHDETLRLHALLTSGTLPAAEMIGHLLLLDVSDARSMLRDVNGETLNAAALARKWLGECASLPALRILWPQDEHWFARHGFRRFSHACGHGLCAMKRRLRQAGGQDIDINVRLVDWRGKELSG